MKNTRKDGRFNIAKGKLKDAEEYNGKKSDKGN